MNKIIDKLRDIFQKSNAGSANDRRYMDMRNKILNLPNSDKILQYRSEKLVGVMMDSKDVDNKGGYSLVVMVDGTTSLYTPEGGGTMGAGFEENVIPVSLKYFDQAKGYLAKARETDSTDLPQKGNVNFYFITPTRLFSISEENEIELGNNKSDASSLFFTAQSVITQVRKTM